jgi:hypothetical protein
LSIAASRLSVLAHCPAEVQRDLPLHGSDVKGYDRVQRRGRGPEMRKLIVSLIAMLTVLGWSAAAEARSSVYRERGSLDGDFTDLNICNWTATFTATGFSDFVLVDTSAPTETYKYHETVNYSLVISADPSVPEPYRGATWRGRNEETFVGTFDVNGDRGVFVLVNPFSEGPFHGLVERVTFVADASGTVHVDRDVFTGTIDCDALTA